MSKSDKFKDHVFACQCSVTGSQLGDLAAIVPSPVELVSRSVPVPCRGARLNEMLEVCRADPTRSDRWPARVAVA
jgi:hypothetical protein